MVACIIIIGIGNDIGCVNKSKSCSLFFVVVEFVLSVVRLFVASLFLTVHCCRL